MAKITDFKQEYEGLSLAKMAKKFASLKQQHEAIKEVAAELWAEVDYLRFTAIVDKMAEEEIDSIRIPDLGTLSLRTEASCSTVDKEALFSWLISNGAKDIVTSVVNSSTLKAFIMNRIREGEGIPGNDIIKFNPYTLATLTKG